MKADKTPKRLNNDVFRTDISDSVDQSDLIKGEFDEMAFVVSLNIIAHQIFSVFLNNFSFSFDKRVCSFYVIIE